ncbi:Death domain-containing adapter protein BG4, partial [Dufourea novaeangliae]
TMTVEIKYNCLLEEFLSTAETFVNDHILNNLKDYYAHCINSNRKLSQIKGLNTLLKVLQKRDTLNFNNVEPLVYIANNYLNDSHVLNKINDYKFYCENTNYSKFCNMYQDANDHKDNNKKDLSKEVKELILQPKLQGTKSECETLSQKCVTNVKRHSKQEEMLQQMVLLQISERIGRSWRDTVRYLGIPESQIDIIENKHPFDMKAQSYMALKVCVFKYSTGNWKLNLIHALEKARRRDLKELAERLILCTKIEQ